MQKYIMHAWLNVKQNTAELNIQRCVMKPTTFQFLNTQINRFIQMPSGIERAVVQVCTLGQTILNILPHVLPEDNCKHISAAITFRNLVLDQNSQIGGYHD